MAVNLDALERLATSLKHWDEPENAANVFAAVSEIQRLRHVAQSRYELLRECQSELRAHYDGGMVETIEAALARI